MDAPPPHPARPAPRYGLPTLIVVGNAMAPDLQPNDRLYYLPTDTLGDDGLYAFLFEGVLKVRYLQQFAGGRLHLMPRNPLYASETLVPAGDGRYRSQASGQVTRFQLVGLVLSHGGWQASGED